MPFVLKLLIGLVALFGGVALFIAVLRRLHTEIPPPEDIVNPGEDAEETASGLRSRVLLEGHGTAHPSRISKVSVHYTGWQTNGFMFDSSIKRGRPVTFKLDKVIKGWREGVQLMVEGEQRRLWIPADLAYGEEPEFGPAGDLVFDIELIKIHD